MSWFWGLYRPHKYQWRWFWPVGRWKLTTVGKCGTSEQTEVLRGTLKELQPVFKYVSENEMLDQIGPHDPGGTLEVRLERRWWPYFRHLKCVMMVMRKEAKSDA